MPGEAEGCSGLAVRPLSLGEEGPGTEELINTKSCVHLIALQRLSL